MYTLLVIAVLLAVLLQPVVATSPVDYPMPSTPFELPYHSMDFNNTVCQLCCFRLLDYCCCLDSLPVLPEMPYAAPDMFVNDTDAFADAHTFDTSLFDFDGDGMEALAPVYEYVHGSYGQPLNDEHIQSMDANETTVQPTTIQTHIEETYTVGDRLPARRPRSRKAAQRRQAPRDGGFSCNADDCDKVFNRQCDLNRHKKTHMTEKPHVCPDCAKGFLYPKDLQRHKQQHRDPSSALNSWRCDHPTCSGLVGFSRKDNLLRHKRKQHMSAVTA
ncbi:Glis family zinc finger 1 [Pyrenophora seminiperda CCB06]|uniref:Glis family zinc finger 1 n=1 Tax=Pyrenophora seminiperda CCB06 TaxID=1302712 RepID=A0A3M7MFV4_9PLEO|nr:Glis family zinc finger 1 [Pyrenophora seminiperda CCB06]